jgi:hypothetical protein
VFHGDYQRLQLCMIAQIDGAFDALGRIRSIMPPFGVKM